VRIEKLQREYGVKVKLVHFPLHPDTPAQGRPMAEFYASRGLDPHQMYLQMKARMDAEGLPYAERTHTYNSRLAQELGAWADTVDGGEALHDALYCAYFVDRRNIGDPQVLLDVVEATGLDVEAARNVLEQRSCKDAVDADWAKSRQYGVTGVPTFVAAGRGVVGAQPYEMLEQLVSEAGAQRRSGEA
jgi:predicted DsbA family dithiol-disulfide isomerase